MARTRIPEPGFRNLEFRRTDALNVPVIAGSAALVGVIAFMAALVPECRACQLDPLTAFKRD